MTGLCVIIGRDPIIPIGKGLPDAFRGYATSPTMTWWRKGDGEEFEIFE